LRAIGSAPGSLANGRQRSNATGCLPTYNE
jgi:hypothetical protein